MFLEVGNFPNYGDFWGPIGRKKIGEFPTTIMGNFALSRFYSKFYNKSYILALKNPHRSLFSTYDAVIVPYLKYFAYLNEMK